MGKARSAKGMAGAALVLALLLNACHKQKEKPTPPAAPAAPAVTSAGPPPAQALPPLAPEPVALKISKSGCHSKDCASFEAKSLRFPQAPALSTLVEQQLVALGSEAREPTVSDLAAHYLQKADWRWQMVLQAKVVRQQGPLIVVDLSAYDYTGGAHGNPSDRLLNYDRAHQRLLGLDDVLLPGQADRFWGVAQKAHQAWAAARMRDDPDFLSNWPFQRTDNFMLGEQGLVLKYGAYAIAPYVEGEPEITIPYAELRGIIRPEWVLGSWRG